MLAVPLPVAARRRLSSLAHRRPAERHGLDLVALYTPSSPWMLPVYGPDGEIIGWTLP